MKFSLKYFLCLYLAVCGFSVYGQNQDSIKQGLKTLTLQEVIAAIDKNPTILSFDDKINSINAYAEGAKSLEAPTVSGGLWMTPYGRPKDNGGMNNSGMDSGGMEEAASEDAGSIMVGVEQMIMNPSKRKAEQKYMLGMASVEESMKSFERQEMIAMAKKAYFEWLVMEKKLRVLEESEELLNLMIKSAEISYTYNQEQLSRIYKAKSELYKIQNMQVMTRNDIRQMNIELNILMNIHKSTVHTIDTSYAISDYNTIIQDTSEIIARRSDIRNIAESAKLNSLKTNFELSKRKPDFGIQFAHMNSLGTMPNQFNLMGMVTIPIVPWASKGYRANVEGLKFENRVLQRRREAIINETTGLLEKIREEISNRKRQMEMYEKNIIPALNNNYKTSLIAFEHMKEDLFMTIDAWMALKMARIEYLDLVGQVLKLQTEYERQIEK